MRIISVLLVVISLLFVSAAQGSRLRPGIEGGYLYSTLDYDEPPDIWDTGGDYGFSLGGFVDIPVNDVASFVPGVRFVRYRNHVDIDTGPGLDPRTEGEFETTQDYLSFPALARLRPFKSNGFFVTLGLEPAFLLAADQQFVERLTIGDIDSSLTETLHWGTTNIENDMETLNFSIDVGAGYELPAEGHLVILQFRYSHGLLGTAKRERWLTNWKTRALELIVGFGW